LLLSLIAADQPDLTAEVPNNRHHSTVIDGARSLPRRVGGAVRNPAHSRAVGPHL